MRLTERDRHLCGLLAQARWLTAEQLTLLAFLGRHERYVRKRLAALSSKTADGGPPLLVRHRWLTRDGVKQVFGLTPAGYHEAEQLLDEEVVLPPQSFELETMAHHVALTELFVSLLAAPLEAALARVPPQLSPAARKRAIGGLYARAVHRGWRWTVVGDGVHLPWKRPEKPGQREKVLRPDAVLELVEARRRVFIECEMGTNTIVPRFDDNKPNSTLSKLERWDAYVSNFANVQTRETWYQQRYPDRFAPEVLFLVHSERRGRNVCDAIQAWRGKNRDTQLEARALTLGQLLSELQVSTPASPNQERVGDAPQFAVSASEIDILIAFLESFRADIHRRRNLNPGEPAGPVVTPVAYEPVKQLCRRLRGLKEAQG